MRRPPKRGRERREPLERCHVFDLAPGQGDRALSLLVHCWFVYRFLEVPVISSVRLCLSSTPGENQPETCPEGLAFVPSFSLCFVWGGKNILNVMFIACV